MFSRWGTTGLSGKEYGIPSLPEIVGGELGLGGLATSLDSLEGDKQSH